MISFMTVLFISACQQKKEVKVTVDGESATFACPMKCEGEKTYPVAGKCPVCGMDLEPVSGAAAEVMYDMWLTTTPEVPEAGKPTLLVFTPKIKGNDAAQVPLDEVHENKIHVILVSKDLAWYDHIHPAFQADGSYTIQESFPAGGEFIIFADYQPTGAANQVVRRSLIVNGTTKKTEQFNTESLTTTTDGYKVVLKPSTGKFLTNNMNHIGVEVTKDGAPVKNFENIMGAKGHLVIISGDSQKYLHVHPDEVEGKLDLHTQFDQAGIYRAFFQFQTNGNLHTSYFTLDVKEGKPGELESPEGHHEHGDGEHQHDHNTGDKHEH